MRPITLALTLLVLTSACENTNDPFLFGQGGGGGGAITQAQATGNWSFTVTKTSFFPCTVGAFADGTRLTAHLDVLTDGTLSSSSSWQNPSGLTGLPLSGSVTFSTGSTDLIFSGGGSIPSGMELRGTISPTGSFAGTLTDPAAGFLVGIGGSACEYSTGGAKA